MSFAGAQEYPLRSFCFERGVSLAEAKSYVLGILNNQDKVGIRESMHCLEIALDEPRVGLVHSYLNRRYQRVSLVGEQAPVSKVECQMEITESEDRNEVTNEAGLGKRTVLKRSNLTESSGTVSSMRLGEGRWGSLEVNGTQVDLRCLKRGERFDIEVRMISPKGFVSTALEVNRGQQIDLGQTVQDLNNKTREVSTQTGVLQKTTEGTRTRRYTLVIR